jgi:methylphosphotriester-DNA--protein-cysteine methyltransferase
MLAQDLHVSVRTLHRAFRRHYGHTPARYARNANTHRQAGTSNSVASVNPG